MSELNQLCCPCLGILTSVSMKQHLNVMMPDELLAALDTLAAERGSNRSELTRLAIWRLLNAPELYHAPTLPNWQVEAWTLLLRSLFGERDLVLTDDVKILLRQAVAALNEREAQVLRLRCGLGGPRHTLTEVGAVLGVNKQRAHQIEVRALRRVRRWLRMRGIGELIGPQLDKNI